MNWEVIGVGLAGLFVLGGIALMASAPRTKEDRYWASVNWEDPKWRGVFHIGDAIPITSEGPLLTHEQRFLVTLNEIGNEVEREVFPPPPDYPSLILTDGRRQTAGEIRFETHGVQQRFHSAHGPFKFWRGRHG